MGYYQLNLPNYTVGEGCYKEIPHTARFFGNKAVVIGGKTAISKAKDKLLAGVAGSDLTITDFLWYGGEASYENGNALIQLDAVKNADILFAVGGGRACDTCKYVATELDKPLFCFPTVASNCASVTGISVIYNPDGSIREYYYPKIADHTFIETSIIADSPEHLLWAGIGDALSKGYEVAFAAAGKRLMHTPLMGVHLSGVCTEPLLHYSKQAMEDIRAKRPSEALEQVTLDIIISTGLVSNMETHLPDYYYNASLAHCVYNGITATKAGHLHRHGEIVSLGVLCLLTYEKMFDERDKIARFNQSLGLPVCFADVDVTPDEFELIADKAAETTEWKVRSKTITRDDFIQCMRDADAYGRTLKQQ